MASIIGLIFISALIVTTTLIQTKPISGQTVPPTVETGLEYFEGKTPFANGGPPCDTCHKISDINVPGGSVGPDLSKILGNSKFSGNATKLMIFLEHPDTPTMSATWSNNPLTSKEITSLVSLISYANKPANTTTPTTKPTNSSATPSNTMMKPTNPAQYPSTSSTLVFLILSFIIGIAFGLVIRTPGRQLA